MAFGEFFTGTSPRYEAIQRFTPQQQQALSQLLNMGLQSAKPVDFAPIAQQARSQFEQKTLPTIAERFTSMGGGAQQSSAFPQILGSAGSELETNLASLQSQFGLQNQQSIFDLLRLGLTPQFEPKYVEGEPGFLESFGVPAAQAAAAYFGGPPAAAATGGGIQSLLQLFGLDKTKQPAKISSLGNSIKQGYGMVR